MNNTQVGSGHGVTCTFILIIVLICIIYNIFAFLYWGEGGASTISRTLHYEIRQHPIIAVVLGALLAHWTWPS